MRRFGAYMKQFKRFAAASAVIPPLYSHYQFNRATLFENTYDNYVTEQQYSVINYNDNFTLCCSSITDAIPFLDWIRNNWDWICDTSGFGSTSDASNGPKPLVSLVFLGEIGVGKSTLLQSFQDYINEKQYSSINYTKTPRGLGKAQTVASMQYQMNNQDYALNILDTPGLGDNEEANKDQQHLDNIINSITELGEFNAICILLKRGTNRTNIRLEYIVNELRKQLPKDVQDNIIIVLTRCETPFVDEQTSAVIEQLGLAQHSMVCIDNSAYEKTKQTSEEWETLLENKYNLNKNNLKKILNMARKMTPYQGIKMKHLRETKHEIDQEIGKCILIIKDLDTIIVQLEENQQALAEAKSDQQKNEAYQKCINVTTYEYIKADGTITTNCNACYKSCHINCQLAYNQDLNQCWCAGNNGMCAQCGCSMKVHCHLGWKSISNTTQKDNDLKKFHYLKGKDRETEITKTRNRLMNEKTIYETKKEEQFKRIIELFTKLKDQAVIGHNVSEVEYYKSCIEGIKKNPNMGSAKKQKLIESFEAQLEIAYILETIAGEH
eukprot:294544_1